jgi:nitrite reductase (NO-forming)
MSQNPPGSPVSKLWPPIATAGLRVAFGVIWAVGAALTWSPDFAVHYVGYLHNAAQGQPVWLSGWFTMWIALVTPHTLLFTWLTRIVETAIALALLTGFARRSVYVVGALFSLLVWSTAEGFGGPYTAGANNMGTAISYVLIFVALIGIDSLGGRSPYSLDYFIERRWPRWRRIAEWSNDRTLAQEPEKLPWRLQIPAMLGVVLLVVFLIAGLHSSMHVKAPSATAAAAAVSPLSLASTKPVLPPRDAHLPPLIGTGSDVSVHLIVSDKSVAIANGVNYQAWTYNGTVPGPIIHVRQGQTVHITLTNHGTMEHSIDFHTAQTEPNLNYIDIKPGKSLKFTFVANVPGAFVYHCETQPILLHVANGMYGVMIVDPITPLPPVAESFVIVQSEWYTQQVSGHLMGANYEKMLAERPDEVVFNGKAFQYRDHPLVATAGKRIRIYFVDAGPNVWSSFHVIGAMLDKVYPDGDAAHALSNVSTYTVGPGAGAIFDLIIPKPGKYAFVDHDMAHLMVGAVGVLDVTPNGLPSQPAPTQAPPAQESPAMKAAATMPAGPYHFDPAKGAALFANNCAACHQASGMGLPGAFPPLKGDPAVLDPNPTLQIDSVLHGVHGRTINGKTYATPMPPFDSLSDADIADIINHERTSWANNGKEITADAVKARRAAKAAP